MLQALKIYFKWVHISITVLISLNWKFFLSIMLFHGISLCIMDDSFSFRWGLYFASITIKTTIFSQWPSCFLRITSKHILLYFDNSKNFSKIFLKIWFSQVKLGFQNLLRTISGVNYKNKWENFLQWWNFSIA